MLLTICVLCKKKQNLQIFTTLLTEQTAKIGLFHRDVFIHEDMRRFRILFSMSRRCLALGVKNMRFL